MADKNAIQKQDEPTIELYMYSLNQEFPRKKGHTTFLKRMNEVKQDLRGKLTEIATVESQVFKVNLPADWSVQWISNEWIENHTKAAGMGILDEVSDPMLRARLREEDFGAILFEPTSDRVFRLNRTGYRLYQQLREFYSKGNRDLAKFSGSANSEPVRRFIAYLEGAGLWIR